jgi:hypothetical protein
MRDLRRFVAIIAVAALLVAKLATPAPAAALFNNPCLGYAVCVDVKIEPVGGDYDAAGTVTGPEGLDCRIVADQIVAGSVCEIYERSLAGPSVTFSLALNADTGSLISCGEDMVATCPSETHTFSSSQTWIDQVTVQKIEFELQVKRTSLDGGSGTVTGPFGLDCGVICSNLYPYGKDMTITAAAVAGSIFAGWSGGGCGLPETCSWQMLSNVTVTAVFAKQVDVAIEMVGSGKVVGEPAWPFSCDSASSTTCDVEAPDGTTIALVAKPASGFTFGSWGGVCASFGSNPTCTIPLSMSTNASATFLAVPKATPKPTAAASAHPTSGPVATSEATSPPATASAPAFTPTPSSVSSQPAPTGDSASSPNPSLAVAAAVSTPADGATSSTVGDSANVAGATGDPVVWISLLVLGLALILFAVSLAVFAMSRRRLSAGPGPR